MRTLGPLLLDPARRLVTVDGAPLTLTPTEFDLLAHLLGRPGRVFTREELLASVWGYESHAGTRTVDVHVAQVRAKLGDAAGLIRTLRGVGYTADAVSPFRTLTAQVIGVTAATAVVAVIVTALVALPVAVRSANNQARAELVEKSALAVELLATERPAVRQKHRAPAAPGQHRRLPDPPRRGRPAGPAATRDRPGRPRVTWWTPGRWWTTGRR